MYMTAGAGIMFPSSVDYLLHTWIWPGRYNRHMHAHTHGPQVLPKLNPEGYRKELPDE